MSLSSNGGALRAKGGVFELKERSLSGARGRGRGLNSVGFRDSEVGFGKSEIGNGKSGVGFAKTGVGLWAYRGRFVGTPG